MLADASPRITGLVLSKTRQVFFVYFIDFFNSSLKKLTVESVSLIDEDGCVPFAASLLSAGCFFLVFIWLFISSLCSQMSHAERSRSGLTGSSSALVDAAIPSGKMKEPLLNVTSGKLLFRKATNVILFWFIFLHPGSSVTHLLCNSQSPSVSIPAWQLERFRSHLDWSHIFVWWRRSGRGGKTYGGLWEMDKPAVWWHSKQITLNAFFLFIFSSKILPSDQILRLPLKAS